MPGQVFKSSGECPVRFQLEQIIPGRVPIRTDHCGFGFAYYP